MTDDVRRVDRARVYRAIEAAEKRHMKRKCIQMRLAAFCLERGTDLERDGEEDPDFTILLDAAMKFRDECRMEVFALRLYITEELKVDESSLREYVEHVTATLKRIEAERNNT